ncbi:aldehyde dehydrogenase [Saprospira grandis]|uniref:aldehyde dehydrogenase n=1 Tax=Saprospira grandis TaxID=1008 RepID=UPI0022DCEC2C|nr:aldehyde dehydrogenase [Saprospira grandis]WBM73428.1 aldehyde dehydrogenase [Saprospira grandis]
MISSSHLLEDPNLDQIPELLAQQRSFFASQQTKSLQFRKAQLERLHQKIVEREQEILAALHSDLRKHEFEAYSTELGFVLVELKKAIQQLPKWMKAQKVGTPLFLFNAGSEIRAEPYGLSLIIGPWNYPFQLLFAPLIGALAAGNTAILKPSELAPATSAISAEIIREAFPPHYVACLEGGVPVAQALLKERFDYIFFTGGTKVGKIIYQAAAQHLTPVTLELGGKSPCLVDRDTDLKATAKRIVWGKFTNAGQTCIAPDYVLVDKAVKEPLIAEMKRQIKKAYGDNPQQSDSLARIINAAHFNRLIAYLKDGEIAAGGDYEEEERYLSPTLMTEVDLNSPLMQEEIFGPILPIISYDSLPAAIEFINQRPKPLALYVFSKNDKHVERVLAETSAGGACVNDTLLHIVNPNLPFGGVGDSGIGAYHGESSFQLFSHQKSVLKRSFLIDDPVRYAPYKLGIKWLKKLMDWTL